MCTTLSVVIPAYNEADRLPPFLDTARTYLDGVWLNGYEVIVVDDGSRDATACLVGGRLEGWERLRLLQHARNRGKGAAIRHGVLAAHSELILVADADGATPIADEKLLREAIETGADLAVGSRRLRGAGALVTRAAHRAAIGQAYAALARWAVPMSVKDPQCGFKMFRREVAQHLVRLGCEDGYLIDTEVLGLAHRLGYRTVEVGITWREVSGSKVNFARDTARMIIGLARVRRLITAQAASDPAPAAIESRPCAS